MLVVNVSKSQVERVSFTSIFFPHFEGSRTPNNWVLYLKNGHFQEFPVCRPVKQCWGEKRVWGKRVPVCTLWRASICEIQVRSQWSRWVCCHSLWLNFGCMSSWNLVWFTFWLAHTHILVSVGKWNEFRIGRSFSGFCTVVHLKMSITWRNFTNSNFIE